MSPAPSSCSTTTILLMLLEMHILSTETELIQSFCSFRSHPSHPMIHWYVVRKISLLLKSFADLFAAELAIVEARPHAGNHLHGGCCWYINPRCRNPVFKC